LVPSAICPVMKKTLLFIGLILLSMGLIAQKSYDYGLFLGATGNHLSNILPVYDPMSVTVAPGGYFRYNLNSRYAIRGGVNIGFDPKGVMPPAGDIHGLFEFNFHALNPRRDNAKFSSYVGTGLSAFISSTPGLYLPFNVGVRYNVSKHITLGLEWALRKQIVVISGGGLDFTKFIDPAWRSHVGLMVGYSIEKTCPTCPFYEKQRTKKRR